jgi:hypothetical protein
MENIYTDILLISKDADSESKIDDYCGDCKAYVRSNIKSLEEPRA